MVTTVENTFCKFFNNIKNKVNDHKVNKIKIKNTVYSDHFKQYESDVDSYDSEGIDQQLEEYLTYYREMYNRTQSEEGDTSSEPDCYIYCTCTGKRTCPICSYSLQSTEYIEPEKNSEETLQETVTFMDESTGLKVGYEAPHDALVEQDSITNASLSEFLSRPVRILSYTWNESDTVGTTTSVNPWYAFFNDSRIKYKLNNFSFIRCNLKVKVLVNASPFYYGATLMAYQPLQNFTPSTIVNDSGTRFLIPYSQRPHLWIYPQHSQGGEMTLPFFYQKNWLRIQTAQDFTDMGVLNFINYTILASANGVTGTGVTVQVFAWAEDVVLSGPSVGLAMQSQDEYGDGMISGPASTVANIASYFKMVPRIGPFATATEMGAKAVAGIAKLFGYTNVPVIEDAKPYRPSPFPQMASPEIGYPVEKLTLDCKNELSIDPGAVGLANHDELSIDYLAGKESYLCTASWVTTSAVDTILFSSRVTPFLFDADGNTNNSKMYFTPIAWTTNMFQHWRGDIIFRFKFIASPYHKGRVKISYDPQGYTGANILNTADTTSAVFTQIVDLGEQSDIEIRVPYQQALAWLRINSSFNPTNIPFSLSASPTFATSDTSDNGTLCMRVVTTLTAPVLTSTIPIIVSVRAADNFELANPVSTGTTFTPYVVQSQEFYGEETKKEVVTGGSEPMVDPRRQKVYFGEVVRSLRPILRRSNLLEVTAQTTAGTNALGYVSHTFGKIPAYYGFDPNGLHTAVKIVGVGNTTFNFTANLPIHWIAPAFIGYKGAGMWHFNVDSSSATTMQVVRRNQNTLSAFETKVSNAASTDSINAAWYLATIPSTQGGTAVTNQLTTSGLSVQAPNYTNFKFQSTKPGNTTKPTSTLTASDYDGSSYDNFQLLVSTNDAVTSESSVNARVYKYWGAGTDFNLYFFLNCPVFYRQLTIPTGV